MCRENSHPGILGIPTISFPIKSVSVVSSNRWTPAEEQNRLYMYIHIDLGIPTISFLIELVSLNRLGDTNRRAEKACTHPYMKQSQGRKKERKKE